jgi:hypothetical protein
MTSRNTYRFTEIIDKFHRNTVHDRRFIETTKILSRMPSGDPTEEELRQNLTSIQRIYSTGDKLYKFAYEYYGNVDYWWIIAWYNNKPTDAHFKIGDIVYIPKELDVALRIATRER